MRDGEIDGAPPALQRSRGAFRLSVGRSGTSDPRTRIRELGQEGCLKLLFPRVSAAAPLEAVMVNISGGVAAGDGLSGRIVCAEGASLVVASQAAERCYRARAAEVPARIAMSLRLEADSSMDWLPQETILFDGAALDRTLDVEMATTSRFLAVESRVFGRSGSGETVRNLRLRDRMRITRGGRLCYVDAIRYDGDAGTALSHAAIGNGATLSATLLLVSPDVATRLEAVRGLLHDAPAEDVVAAASCWNGMLSIRLLSSNDVGHRNVLRSLLEHLRDDRPLPRVWQG